MVMQVEAFSYQLSAISYLTAANSLTAAYPAP
jgi:hypothetical protein